MQKCYRIVKRTMHMKWAYVNHKNPKINWNKILKIPVILFYEIRICKYQVKNLISELVKSE